MDHSLPSGRSHASILSCFPPSVGRDVAVAVVKPLRAGACSPLLTDRQVCVCVCVLSVNSASPQEGGGGGRTL